MPPCTRAMVFPCSAACRDADAELHSLLCTRVEESAAAHLDRLWDELFYVAREPLKYQVAFEAVAGLLGRV